MTTAANTQDDASSHLSLASVTEAAVSFRVKRRRPTNETWRRFMANRLSVFGLAVIVALVLASALIPAIFPVDPDAIDYYRTMAPPGSPGHVLGTDDLGRDLMARLAAGGRLSLLIGLSVATVGVGLGSLLGAVAGFYRGAVDMVISRLIEILMSIPLLALLMVVSGFTKVGPFQLVALMAITGWMGVARLVRGQVLSLRETEFIMAAQAIGASNSRIVLRHLLPNVVAPITVAATLAVAAVILTESALSYLGFGVRPPTATWGNMLQGAQRYMGMAPWLSIMPGLLIALTVTSFNFLGDGLREAMDPRLKNRFS